MKKRGAIGVEHFIAAGIVIVTIVVILTVVMPRGKTVFERQVEISACDFSVILTGIGLTSAPEGCNAHVFQVTEANLSKDFEKAKDRLKVINADKKYAQAIQGSPELNVGRDPPDKAVYEFALNNIIAKEMLTCGSDWKQNLPLMDKWYQLLECRQDDNTYGPCSGPDQVFSAALPAYGLFTYAIGQKQFKKVPTLCMVCSIIKFDQIRSKMAQYGIVNVRSLPTWMNVNYPKLGGNSYGEEITAWQTGVTGLWQPKYEYSLQEWLAVVFVYVPSHRFWDNMITDLLGVSGEDVKLLRLIPYTQEALFGPQPEGQGCIYLLE